MRMLSVTAVVTLLSSVLLAGSASAQHTVNAEQACTPDAMRLCSEFIPDEKRITACLRKNRSALSSECRNVFRGGGATKRHRHHHRAS
jgi:type II secretory pathway component PulL